MKCNIKWLCLLVIVCAVQSKAQDINADSLLNASTADTATTHRVQATFNSTRLINSHTVGTTQGGVLDLRISHRFGEFDDGFYNLFGLDFASIRIGMDYGLTNRLTVGGGRSSYQKQYDGFLKYALLRQSEGEKNMPVSVTLLASVMFETDTSVAKSEKLIPVKPNTEDKFSYAYQLLIARKFSDAFSLQLMPSLVHENLVDSTSPSNNIFSMGAAVRVRLTKRTGIIAEYYYTFPGTKISGTYNSFSLGYEVETAGHVFQIHLTNSNGMTEKNFIAETRGQWHGGDIRLGFNISRVFTIYKPKNIRM